MRERLREVADSRSLPGRTPRRAGRRRCAAPAAARTAPRPRQPALQRVVRRRARTCTGGTRPRRGRPSTSSSRRRRGSAGRSRRAGAPARSPRPCRRPAGRSRAGSRRAGSSAGWRRARRAVRLRERAELGVEALAAHLGVDLVAQRAPAVDRALRARAPRSLRTARSNATQAITFEWAKWRRGPRTSQMPSSGSRQPTRGSRAAAAAAPRRPSTRARPGTRGRGSSASDDLAVDVELELVAGGVADRAPAASPRSPAATRARARSAAARRRGRT